MKHNSTDELREIIRSRRGDCSLQGCDEMVRAQPTNPEVLHFSALSHAKVGHFKYAYTLFEKAIEYNPESPAYLINFANACRQNRDLERARELAMEAKTLSPDIPEIRNILGAIYLDLGEKKLAEQEFRHVLRLDPSFTDARKNLARTLQLAQKLKEARSVYAELLDIEPNNVDLMLQFSQVCVHLRENEAAQKVLKKASILDPKSVKVRRAINLISPRWNRDVSGKSVRLERQNASHCEFIFDCYMNSSFMTNYNRFLYGDMSREEFRNKLLQQKFINPSQCRSIDWVLIKEASSKILGLASLVELNLFHRRAEILIGIPEERNRRTGVALEGTLLVFDYAFNIIGLEKLTSLVYSDNDDAVSNTLALGFRREAYFKEHIRDPKSGKKLDIVGFGLLESDFRMSDRISRLSLRLLKRDITKPVGERLLD